MHPHRRTGGSVRNRMMPLCLSCTNSGGRRAMQQKLREVDVSSGLSRWKPGAARSPCWSELLRGGTERRHQKRTRERRMLRYEESELTIKMERGCAHGGIQESIEVPSYSWEIQSGSHMSLLARGSLKLIRWAPSRPSRASGRSPSARSQLKHGIYLG